MDLKYIKNLLEKIQSKKPRVLVLGDVMLDQYVSGDVDRISPEAPVPILKFKRERTILGGAGNVAHNLVNLFSMTDIATIIGDDKSGEEINNLLNKFKISNKYVLKNKKINTTKKTRYLSNGSQLLRLDNDSTGFREKDLHSLGKLFLEKISKYDSIVISDYNKGVCSKILVENLIKYANNLGITVFIDPKGPNWIKYNYATCITPNKKEVESEVKFKCYNDIHFEKAAKILIDKFKLKSCLITRGPDGMTYVDNENTLHQKVGRKEVFDVSGAGDTVIACMVASLSSGLNVLQSLELSSYISSKVVTYLGTTPFNIEMLE